jgi:hypothetical protein
MRIRLGKAGNLTHLPARLNQAITAYGSAALTADTQ